MRERPEDIPALAEHFNVKYSEANGVPLRPLSDETVDLLKRAQWSGNVRELENTIHRAVLLAQGDSITPDAIRAPDGQPLAMMLEAQDSTAGSEDAPAEAAGKTAESLVGRTVADVERDLILETLNHCLGNRTHAANILGISIRTLRNKLKQYSNEGVPVPMPGDGNHRAAL